MFIPNNVGWGIQGLLELRETHVVKQDFKKKHGDRLSSSVCCARVCSVFTVKQNKTKIEEKNHVDKVMVESARPTYFSGRATGKLEIKVHLI